MKKWKYYILIYLVMMLFIAKLEIPYFTVKYDPSIVTNPELFLIRTFESQGVYTNDTLQIDSLTAQNHYTARLVLDQQLDFQVLCINNFTRKDTISNVQITYSKRRGCGCSSSAKINCYKHNRVRKEDENLYID